MAKSKSFCIGCYNCTAMACFPSMAQAKKFLDEGGGAIEFEYTDDGTIWCENCLRDLKKGI
jgi:hypothetical protein